MDTLNCSLKLATAPVVEPVSLAEAKTHLRVDTSTDDTYISNLITAARQQVEVILGRALVTQSWDMAMDRFPNGSTMEIPLPPLRSITTIKYTTALGVENTFSSTNYYVNTYREPGIVKLIDSASWPSDILRPMAGVVVRFEAGFGDAAAVPMWAKQAILLLTGDLYENREDTLIGIGVTQMPSFNGMMSLLWPHRMGVVR